MKSDNLCALITVILCLLALAPSLFDPDAPLGMRYLFYGVICLGILYVLQTVCTSDDYMYMSKRVGHIYIYKVKGGYTIERVSANSYDLKKIKKYEILQLKDFQILVYEDDEGWWHWQPDDFDLLPLGQRINKTTFVLSSSGTTCKKILVFDDSRKLDFTASTYSCENVYVPPRYEKEIQFKKFNYLCGQETRYKHMSTPPEQYCVLKEDGEYTVLGMTYNKQSGPSCWQLAVPLISFDEGDERVMLKCINHKYKEIVREPLPQQ